jgi:hypothetical protein
MQGIEVFLRPDHLGINALHPGEGVRKWHDLRKPYPAISVKLPALRPGRAVSQ